MTPGGRAAQRVETIQQRLDRKREQLDQTQREIAGLESQLHQWQAGFEGEQQVASVLEELRSDGWLLLHDVHWPGRPRANLDHVAIGPGGVVVVDAKRWSGAVTVDRGRLWNGSWPKTRECESAAQMASDVASLLHPEHRTAVSSVICLVEHPIPPTPVEGGAVAVGDAHLADHLRSLPHRLDDDDVLALTADLHELLAGPTSPAVPTTQTSEQRSARPAATRLEVLGAVASGTVALGTSAPAAPAALPTRRALREAEALASGKRLPRRRVPGSRPAVTWEHLVGYLALAALAVGAAIETVQASR